MEKYIREEAPHKHLIFVLNKCDLVPTGVAVSTAFRLSFSMLLTPPFAAHHFSNRQVKRLSCTLCFLPWITTLLRVGYINTLSAAFDLSALRRLLAVLGS